VNSVWYILRGPGCPTAKIDDVALQTAMCDQKQELLTGSAVLERTGTACTSCSLVHVRSLKLLERLHSTTCSYQSDIYGTNGRISRKRWPAYRSRYARASRFRRSRDAASQRRPLSGEAIEVCVKAPIIASSRNRYNTEKEAATLKVVDIRSGGRDKDEMALAAIPRLTS
jgi:hypothetical protein